MFAIIVLQIICAVINATLDWSIMEFSLIVLPGKKNCDDGCNGIGLDCFNDIIDIDTLNEDFIREWFYLFGWADQHCTINDNPRSVVDQPAYSLVTRQCYGWKHGTKKPACGQTTTLNVDARTICMCGNLKGQEQELKNSNWTLTAEDSTFKALQVALPHQQAQAACRDFTAMPPSIRNEQEQETVHKMAKSVFGPGQRVWLNWNNEYWYDLKQHRSWQTQGGPHPYENWELGQPAAPATCAYMDTTTGKWFTDSCFSNAYVLCRMDPFLWWGMRENCWFPEKDTKFSGPVLAVHENTQSVERCARLCQRNLQCLTANYRHATKECELIPQMAQNHPANVMAEAGVDMLERIINSRIHE